jgi:hypothetical protein
MTRGAQFLFGNILGLDPNRVERSISHATLASRNASISVLWLVFLWLCLFARRDCVQLVTLWACLQFFEGSGRSRFFFTLTSQ